MEVNMKRLLKKYGWILIIIIIVTFLVLLPVFINWCYTIPSWDEIFEKPQEWTEFWGTYLGAIASFVMVFITWLTLRQMKKQWEDEHCPQLEFYFIKGTLPVGKDKYPVEGHKIEVLNIGKSPATGLNFCISQEVVDYVKDSKAKEALSKIGSNIQLSLLPNEARRFTLCEKTIDRGKKSLYSYYIADVEVNEDVYEYFTARIKELKTMHLKGIYNQGCYKIDVDIPINGIRNSHVSITEAIMNIKSSLDQYMLSIENNGFNVNIKNNGTEQQK